MVCQAKRMSKLLTLTSSYLILRRTSSAFEKTRLAAPLILTDNEHDYCSKGEKTGSG
jgi:hypothetical protein